MERQLSSATSLRAFIVQKAIDTTEDPIDEADGDSYVSSGQKADAGWGDDDRTTHGDSGMTPEKLKSLAKKAMKQSKRVIENSSQVEKWGFSGSTKPKTPAPAKAPASTTGFSLRSPAKPQAPAAPAPTLGFDAWPSMAKPGSQKRLNRALDEVISLSGDLSYKG